MHVGMGETDVVTLQTVLHKSSWDNEGDTQENQYEAASNLGQEKHTKKVSFELSWQDGSEGRRGTHSGREKSIVDVRSACTGSSHRAALIMAKGSFSGKGEPRTVDYCSTNWVQPGEALLVSSGSTQRLPKISHRA